MDIKSLRKEIDKLDGELLEVLARRKKIVDKIFKLKNELNLPKRDLEREKEMFEVRTKLAKKLDLSPNFIEKLFELIINESIKEQRKI
ncbi:MAG: chorismate mutase [Nanoarchaeota archaeon]|nr:chorismate mutase [Nanoarchaeota archaeon]MBU1631610.1 chorismate mutase [Nanoarchaeota archaeon]MBU1876637.1 chorismate mutase [Nanoarchaeota archaeon]